jgi:hypothetical protein
MIPPKSAIAVVVFIVIVTAITMMKMISQGYFLVAPVMSFVNGGGTGGGDRVMKVVLITKDEKPLIRSWVHHHGHLFGFHNLHIVDGSSDPGVIKFLVYARDRLGVDVVFSPANLNEVEGVFNRKMEEVRGQCDFMIKLDTDELLVLYDGDDDNNPNGGDNRSSSGVAETNNRNKFSLSKDAITHYINSLPFDGAMYKAGYVASNKIEKHLCRDDDNVFVTSTTFSPFRKSMAKTFVASPSYDHMDLGGHTGRTHPAFRGKDYHITRLALVEFHTQCFHRVLENDMRAMLSHGYLTTKNVLVGDDKDDHHHHHHHHHLRRDQKEAMIEILSALLVDFPQHCRIPSCHKAFEYLQYLKNPERSEMNYYLENAPTVDSFNSTLLRDSLVAASLFSVVG